MSKLIIGLAGSIGSGKGTAAAYLSRKYGADMFTFSTPLRQILSILWLPQARLEFWKLSRILRDAYGVDILSQIVARIVLESSHKIVVLDGVRRVSDLDTIKDNPDFKLLYIDAPLEVRYERVKSRAQNSGDATKTYEQFLLEEEWETEVTIRTLKPYAASFVNNNQTESEFYAAIDAFIEENLPKA